MKKFGIDVSQHQGKIDWDKVKGQIDFAILRLGWIGNKNNHTIDTQFERNYSECKRLGIPVGVYIYSYANSVENMISGAKWTNTKLEGKELELPVYIDMEDNSLVGLGKNKLTEMTIAFNNAIDSRFQKGVYANRNWFTNYLNESMLKSYSLWIAVYTSGTDKYTNYDIWQNSSSGQINGITGKVDTNYMYADLISQKEEVKVEDKLELTNYQNGASQNVYADTNLTVKTGSLDTNEVCECLGTFNNRKIVRYKVNGQDNYKIGFIGG